MVLNNLGKAFGFSVNNEIIYNIVDSVCGVLVVFGVLTMKSKDETSQNAKTEEDTSQTEDANLDEQTKTIQDDSQKQTDLNKK